MVVTAVIVKSMSESSLRLADRRNLKSRALADPRRRHFLRLLENAATLPGWIQGSADRFAPDETTDDSAGVE